MTLTLTSCELIHRTSEPHDREDLNRQIEDLDFECHRLRSRLAYSEDWRRESRGDYERARDEVLRLRAIIHRPRAPQSDEVPF